MQQSRETTMRMTQMVELQKFTGGHHKVKARRSVHAAEGTQHKSLEKRSS